MLTYGGVVQTLEVPDADGEVADVVLGFEDLAGHVSEDDPCIGSLISRHGNCIAGGTFGPDGGTHQLPHGGPVGRPGGGRTAGGPRWTR